MTDDLLDVPGVDELYELMPSEFVAARDALAKRVRSEGDRDAAAAIKRLTKPTVVAHAINQVARRDRDGIDRLLAASAEVRDAQAKAVRGEDAAALRKASRVRREIVQRLADAAATIAGATNRDEAATTFEAASLDDEAAVSLRAGRLTRTLAPSSGFGLEGMPEPTPRLARDDAYEPALNTAHGPVPAQRDDQAVERAEQALGSANAALEKAEAALERAVDRRRGAQERLEAAVDAHQRALHDRDAAAAKRDQAADDVRVARGDSA
ncbi:MAG TPA: hypothetical protein VNB24_03620 [Acidimicrobiales bacterium]|nr:hypothetical protein [Acidimicrobiales bacterium]